MKNPPRPRRQNASSPRESAPSVSTAEGQSAHVRAENVELPSDGARSTRVQSEQKGQSERSRHRVRPARPSRSQSFVLRSLRTPTGNQEAADALGSSRDEREVRTVERIDERIRARRYGWVRSVLTFTLSVAGAAVVAWIVFFSPLFALQADRIVVSGGDERFTDVQGVELLGHHAGVPITRMLMSSLEDELMSVQQVKNASVSRSWPDGLSVELVMRVPVMAELSDEGVSLLDEEAVVLAVVPDIPEGLAAVVLPSEEEDRVRAAADLAVVRGVLPDSFRSQVDRWVVEAHQIRCELKDSRVVKWGTVEDSELKAKVLLPLFEQRSARVYDVSVPLTPVTAQ